MSLRGILLMIVVFGLLPMVLKYPHVGALMWAWVSLMSPHRLTSGFAYAFPFAAIIAATTLLALVFSKQRRPLPMTSVTVMLILFVLWMSVTSLFAIAPGDVIYNKWVSVLKIHLMLLVTLMLIRGKDRIEQLIWVMVVSIGYFGFKGGIWTVLTGGAERVWGPPGTVIEGNNELALALVVLLPLMFYLTSTAKRKWIKYGLIFAMISCVFSVLGSHSRGAFLAILAAAGMLVLKSKHAILMGIVGTVVLAGTLSFMPEKWLSRMHTIEAGGEADESAASRLITWQTLYNMAKDRPIVGAGFETALPEIFLRYSPIPEFKAYAAHSIYFQVMGEHGFVGLAIYLTLMFVTWRRATRVARLCRATPGFEWGDLLMRMTQVSLMGFLVGGAFLSLLHFDFPYYLMGLVVLVEATLRESQKMPSPQAVPMSQPPPPDGRPVSAARRSMPG